MEIKDLIGKTISLAEKMSPKGYEETPYLKLQFTDGTQCYFMASYGGFGGDVDCEGEYPRDINIQDSIEGDS